MAANLTDKKANFISSTVKLAVALSGKISVRNDLQAMQDQYINLFKIGGLTPLNDKDFFSDNKHITAADFNDAFEVLDQVLKTIEGIDKVNLYKLQKLIP